MPQHKVCKWCGVTPVKDRRRRCGSCNYGRSIRREKAETQRAVRHDRIKLGICRECGKADAMEGHRMCMECAAKTVISRIKLRAKRFKAGKCTYCGKYPIAKGKKSRCTRCTNKVKRYNKRSKKTGKVGASRSKELCARCGKNYPEWGFKSCSDCLGQIDSRVYGTKALLRKIREGRGSVVENKVCKP